MLTVFPILNTSELIIIIVLNNSETSACNQEANWTCINSFTWKCFKLGRINDLSRSSVNLKEANNYVKTKHHMHLKNSLHTTFRHIDKINLHVLII